MGSRRRLLDVSSQLGEFGLPFLVQELDGLIVGQLLFVEEHSTARVLFLDELDVLFDQRIGGVLIDLRAVFCHHLVHQLGVGNLHCDVSRAANLRCE